MIDHDSYATETAAHIRTEKKKEDKSASEKVTESE